MGRNSRVRVLNDRPIRAGARYVLYWAQANRRVDGNHGLLHAVELARRVRLPVLFFEELDCESPHANDRSHTFLIEGVPETQRRLRQLGIGYVFYLRRQRSDPADVLDNLAADAAAVVTDDYPSPPVSSNNESLPKRFDIAWHVVDSSCIVPASLFPKREYAARTFRPKIQAKLAEYLVAPETLKSPRRFAGPVSAFHTEVRGSSIARLVAGCEIDHSVPPSLTFQGGRGQAEAHLEHFVRNNLRRFARHRNEPSAHATSELSPYLHAGLISPLEIALRVQKQAAEDSLIADEFLEELVVRRELAFNFVWHVAPPYTLDCLPDWVRATLRKHARDKRSPSYPRDRFEKAETHDALWNATQKELLLRGKIHGYYRMYWGKKIIEWSPSHEDALATMIHLHDRYAIDGHDPNTYTNIHWCFGLHDRPWEERPVFGTIRYMSLEGMKRKTDVEAYLTEIDQLERTGRDPFRIQ